MTLKRSFNATPTEHNPATASNHTPTHGATPLHHTPTAALGHSHALLVFAKSTQFLFTFFFLIPFWFTDGMCTFQVVMQLRLVPERLQTHAACNTVVFIVKK
jgi:hypothetical protein